MAAEVERRVAELRRLVQADPKAAGEAGDYLAGRFGEELAKLTERRNRDKEDLCKLIEIAHAMHTRPDEMYALSERVIDPAHPPEGWTWLNAQVRKDGRPPVWQEEIYQQLGRVDREACDVVANIAGHIRNAERGRCGQFEGPPLSDIEAVQPIDAYVHGLWLHSGRERAQEEIKQHVLEGDPLAEPRAKFRALGKVIRTVVNIRTETALGPADAWRIGVLYLVVYDPSFDPDAVGFANLTPWGPPETEVDEAATLPDAFVERRELCEVLFNPDQRGSGETSTLERRFEEMAASAVTRLRAEERIAADAPPPSSEVVVAGSAGGGEHGGLTQAHLTDAADVSIGTVRRVAEGAGLPPRARRGECYSAEELARMRREGSKARSRRPKWGAVADAIDRHLSPEANK